MNSFKFLFSVCFIFFLTLQQPSLAFKTNYFSHLSFGVDTIILRDSILIDTNNVSSIKLKSDSTLLVDSLSADSIINLKNKSALKSKVTYSAKDSIRYDITGKMVYLYNGAVVNYEDIELKADYIIINQETLTIYAEGVADSTGKIKGKPDFKQGSEAFKADKVAYNFKSKKGKIENAVTAQGEGFLRGTDIKKNDKDEIYTKNGIFTTCDLDIPHYGIAIPKSKTTKKRIISGPAYLQIEGVPLPLAIPFGFFPKKNERASGLVFPQIGEDQLLGFFFREGGYYLGISDHLDLKITGNIYTKGSFALNTLSRYSTKYKYSGQIGLGYSDRKEGEKGTSSFNNPKDFQISWSHNQDPALNPGTTFSANVNVQSSTNLRNNSYNVIDQVTNTIVSSINFNKSSKNDFFNFNSSISYDQNTNTGAVTLRSPEFSFNTTSFRPFDNKESVGKKTWIQKINLRYELNGLNKVSTGDSTILKRETLDQFTTDFRHSIPINTSFQILKHFTFSPSFNYNEYLYLQSSYKYFNGVNTITDTAKGVLNGRDYGASASLTTIIFGQLNINKLGINAIRHVFTPSLAFSFRPDFSDQKFGFYQKIRDDRSLSNPEVFSLFESGSFGGPTRGRSESVSFSLNNNIEMKVRNKNDTISGFTKVKILESLNFNGNYNFAADSLRLSTISMNGRTVILNKINIDFGANYDPYVRIKTSDNSFTRIDKFELIENLRLIRLTNANLALTSNLNGTGTTRSSTANNITNLNSINDNQPSYVDFSIPWNLGLSYFIVYNADANIEGGEKKYTQTINVNGDLNLTKKWKVSATTGYNINTKEITPTNININRDLHCWDLAIRWTPFGFYQSYGVVLRVKASILQDLKLNRQKDFYVP